MLGGPVRTRWSITKQWGRVKLANRRRSRLMKKKRVWKAGEQRKFKAYLRRYSKTQTPEEIGKVWAVARSTVARWQNALGLKVPREAVVKMAYSQRKQSAARKRIQRASKQMWVARRAGHAIQRARFSTSYAADCPVWYFSNERKAALVEWFTGCMIAILDKVGIVEPFP